MSNELDDILVSLLDGNSKEQNKPQTSSNFVVNVFRRLYKGGVGALLLILLTLIAAFFIQRYLGHFRSYTTSMEIMLMKEKDGGRNSNITSEIVGGITGWHTTTNKYDELHIMLSRPVLYRMLRNTHQLDSALFHQFKELDRHPTSADTLALVDQLTRQFSKAVEISYSDGGQIKATTSILTLSIKGYQGKSKRILNGIVEAYNANTRAYNNMCYANTLRFLDYCIDSVRQEINRLDNYEVNFSESNFVVNLSQQSNYYLGIDRDYEDEVRDMQLQQNLLQIIRSYMIDMGDDYRVVPANTGINDEQINKIVLQFNDLVMRRSNFMTSMGQDAMRVQTITNQIEDQRQAIIISIDKLAQALDIRLRQAFNNLKESNERLLKMPRKQLVKDYIQRERAIISPLYTQLQQKRTETLIAQATEQDQARIITPPYVTESALFASAKKFYLLALLIGIILAFIYLYKLELPDQNLSVEDVLAKCAVPVWGILPADGRNDSSQQELRYSTALHSLFTRIEMSGTHLLLITSGYESEGKTHFTEHLAQLLEQQQKPYEIFRWQETTELLDIIKERNGRNTDVYTLIDAGSYHENPDMPLLSREAENTIYCIRAEHSRMASLDFVNYAVKEKLLFNGAVIVTEAIVDSKNAVNFGSFDYIVPSGFAAIKSSIRRDKGL